MKRILGLDVGDKTLGVAVSDELGLTAQGVTVRQRSSSAADMAFLRETCALYEVAAIVVGLPKNMDGSLGPQAQKTLAFIEQVRRAAAVPVIPWDERLTTQAAERALLETKPPEGSARPPGGPVHSAIVSGMAREAPVCSHVDAWADPLVTRRISARK
jgi:putative holliday junction resolvase